MTSPEPLRPVRVKLFVPLLSVVLGLFVTMTNHAQAQQAPENQLKAALIYNFMLFTEWPVAGLGSNEILTLCALKSGPVSDALIQLQKKTVGNHELRFKLLAEQDSLQSCKVLYLDDDEHQRPAQIRKKLEGLSVLTISDRERAIDEGAMIAIAVDNNRFVFEVNASSARQAGFTISSKLLRLARKVW